MKVGLIDLDSKMPVLPLMKIKTYYGENAKWVNTFFEKFDKVYISKLFDFTKDINYCINADEVIKGGTGYDIQSKLPDEIEKCQPDYSIYPNCDYSIQFFSRGCIRNCPFCVVREKEGYIYPVEPMELNLKGKHIEIFDNNFFANPEWKKAIDYLIEKNQKVNFHGVDVRIMTSEQAYWLNKLKHYKQIHIAWDNPKENVLPKIKEMCEHIKPYKIMCYVLIGYWSTHEEDLYRIIKLRELGVDPFVMPFNKKDKLQKKVARWCNNKFIFKKCEKFEDYKGCGEK